MILSVWDGGELVSLLEAPHFVLGCKWGVCAMGRPAQTQDLAGDLKIFSLALSQLSYQGCVVSVLMWHNHTRGKCTTTSKSNQGTSGNFPCQKPKKKPP